MLSVYAFQGELNEKYRNILADIVVNYELKDNLDTRYRYLNFTFINHIRLSIKNIYVIELLLNVQSSLGRK